MKTLADLEQQDMSWVKARRRRLFDKPRFELRTSDGEVLASITRRGGWRSAVEVDAPGSHWLLEYKPRLFKRPQITIRSVGTGEEPAVFEPKGFEGTLTYPDGRVFTFTRHTRVFKATRWVWALPDGSPILGIEIKSGWSTRGEISLDPDIPTDVLTEKAPPLLLFLGWYLILLHEDEQAAASAAAMLPAMG
ncbi:MAG: hypothetical protein IPK19_39985 [Chloroflexi bacterium]|nr:hypothetical protein [Chloroflexota bacterium]